MSLRVLVTGGTGFIGRRVVDGLCARGRPVVCMVRRTSKRERLSAYGVEFVEGNLADEETVASAMEDCDFCIHLAGPSSWDALDLPSLEGDIVGGARRMVSAAKRSGLKRLVYVSSTAAVGARPQPVVLHEASEFGLENSGLRYAIAKREAEMLVQEAVAEGLDAVVVCPAETYGADDEDLITAGQILQILKTWPGLAAPGGTSIVHVDDVADGIILALDQGSRGGRYILGGDNLEFREMVSLVLRIAARRKPVVLMPKPLIDLAITGCRAVHLPPPVPPALAGYLGLYWFVDSTKARRELGYAPRDAEATLRPVVDWLQRRAVTGKGAHR